MGRSRHKRPARIRALATVAAANVGGASGGATNHRCLLKRQERRTAARQALQRDRDAFCQTRLVEAALQAAPPTTFEGWACHWAEQPQRWQTAPTRGPPLWPCQREVIDRLHVCVRAPCAEGGGCGAVLVEGTGNGKTRDILQFKLEDARRQPTRFGPGAPTLIIVPKTLLAQWQKQWQLWMTAELLCVQFLAAGSIERAMSTFDARRVYACIDAVVITGDMLVSAMAPSAPPPPPSPLALARIAAKAEEYALCVEQHCVADAAEAGQRAIAAARTAWLRDVVVWEQTEHTKRALYDVEWRHIVVEEGTTLANANTALFAACARLRAHARILVSATPILNAKASELNGILQFLGNRCVFSAAQWGDLGVQAQRRRVLAHFWVRSAATAAAGPARVAEPRWVSLSSEERALYDECKRQAGYSLPNMTRLRKLTISPALLVPPALRDPARLPSAKIAEVLFYLRERLAADEKALLFCMWQSSLAELGFHLAAAGYTFAIIHAHTELAERWAIVDAFQSTPVPRLLLMTPRLAIGIDGLQRANHVLLVDGHWQKKLDQQMLGRARRPGQTRPVHFVQFIVDNTIDRDMFDVGSEKERQDAAMFGVAAAGVVTDDDSEDEVVVDDYDGEGEDDYEDLVGPLNLPELIAV